MVNLMHMILNFFITPFCWMFLMMMQGDGVAQPPSKRAREIQWLDLEFHYFCVDKSYSLMTCNKDIHSARLVCLFFALGKSLGVFEVAYYQRSGLRDMYR